MASTKIKRRVTPCHDFTFGQLGDIGEIGRRNIPNKISVGVLNPCMGQTCADCILRRVMGGIRRIRPGAINVADMEFELCRVRQYLFASVRFAV